MFLLVPAYLGSPGQKAVKRLCVCLNIVGFNEVFPVIIICFSLLSNLGLKSASTVSLH